jgi:hypothetical protein
MSNTTRRNRKTAPPAAKRPAWLIPAALVGLGAVLIAIALLLIQGGQQKASSPQVTGKPSAEIDRTMFDYGDVRVDTPVETMFRVKNVGDQPLTILQEPQVELVQGC